MIKTTNDLEIGDVIKLHEGSYGCATVIEKDTDYVSVIRPYIHMVGEPVCDKNGKYIKEQVLIYGDPMRGISTIGFETVKLFNDSSAQWTILK